MTFKSFTKSKKAVLVVGLILLTIVITGCFGGTSSNAVLAEVGEDNITQEDMDDIIKMVRLFSPDMDSMLTEDQHVAMFEDTFLGMLIDNHLIRQEVDRLGLEIDEADVDKALEDFRNQLILEQYGSEKELDDRISDLKLSEEIIKGLLRSEVYGNVLFDHIVADITEEEVRAFAEEYPQLLVKEPGYVKVHHILLETEEEALAVLARVKDGEDFNSVAEDTSIDDSVVHNRGDLGKISEGDNVDPAFMAASFALGAGEISDPVESSFGWHIVKVDEKQEGSNFDFNEKEKEVREAKEGQVFGIYFEKMWESANVVFPE